MKKISVVTACFNEEANVEDLYKAVKTEFERLPQYQYEHIFIDNCSTDKTPDILREIALKDPSVKVILNMRNFGHIRSPSHALLSAEGDAVISIVCDFQDPPSMIPLFLSEWEKGWKVVAGIKAGSSESQVFFMIRRAYYKLVHTIAETEILQNFTGFGLFDRQVMDEIRQIKDPYPYFRGLISELGFPVKKIPYQQPQRKRGLSKNNFYQLYDMAMLGITSHSKVPLRLATMGGFTLSFLSFALAIIYFLVKLFFWKAFPTGMAPILMGMFFFFSVQLFFIGLLGEYILSIHTRTLNRPLVVEKERLNFKDHST